MIFVTLTQKQVDSIVVQSKSVYAIFSVDCLCSIRKRREEISLAFNCEHVIVSRIIRSKLTVIYLSRNPYKATTKMSGWKPFHHHPKKNEQKQKQPTSSKYNKKNWKTTIQNSLKLEKVLTGRPKYRLVGWSVGVLSINFKATKIPNIAFWFAFFKSTFPMIYCLQKRCTWTRCFAFYVAIGFFCVEFYT